MGWQTRNHRRYFAAIRKTERRRERNSISEETRLIHSEKGKQEGAPSILETVAQEDKPNEHIEEIPQWQCQI